MVVNIEFSMVKVSKNSMVVTIEFSMVKVSENSMGQVSYRD